MDKRDGTKEEDIVFDLNAPIDLNVSIDWKQREEEQLESDEPKDVHVDHVKVEHMQRKDDDVTMVEPISVSSVTSSDDILLDFGDDDFHQLEHEYNVSCEDSSSDDQYREVITKSACFDFSVVVGGIVVVVVVVIGIVVEIVVAVVVIVLLCCCCCVVVVVVVVVVLLC